MKDADLIRQLIRLRTRDPVPEETLRLMGAAQLHARPEALVLAIVRGYYEFKSNGYADADIYREIEGRRAAVYGEEPLPADLNLDSYTSYRLRLEHPREAALHDPAFAIQAVHRVREFLEGRFGPAGMPVTFRTMPWMNSAILAYAALVGIGQGILPASELSRGRVAADDIALLQLLIAVAIAIVAAAIGFVGKAVWGRPLLLASLGVQFLIHVSLYIYQADPRGAFGAVDASIVAFMVAHLGVLSGFAVYAYRAGRPGPAPA